MNNVDFYDKQVRFQEDLRKIQEKRLTLEQEFHNLSKTDKKLKSIRTNKLRSYYKQISDRERHARQRNEALLKDFGEFEDRLRKVEAETTRLELVKNKCEDELTKFSPQWRYGIDINKARTQLQDGGAKFEPRPVLPNADRILTTSPPPSLIPHIDMPLFKLVPFNFNQNAMSLRVDSPEKAKVLLDDSHLQSPVGRDAVSRDKHSSPSYEPSVGMVTSHVAAGQRPVVQQSVVVPPLNLPSTDGNVTSHSSSREDQIESIPDDLKAYHAPTSAYHPSVDREQPTFGSFDIVTKPRATHPPVEVRSDDVPDAVDALHSNAITKNQEDSLPDDSELSSFATPSLGSKSGKPSSVAELSGVKPVMSVHIDHKSDEIAPSNTSSPIKIPRPSVDSLLSEPDPEPVQVDVHRQKTPSVHSDLNSSDDNLTSENPSSKEPPNDAPLTSNPAYLKMRQFGDTSTSFEASKDEDSDIDPQLENQVTPKSNLFTINDNEFSDEDRSLSVGVEKKTSEKPNEFTPAVKKPTFTSRFAAKKQRAPWDTESEEEDSYRIPRAGTKLSTDDDDDFAFFD